MIENSNGLTSALYYCCSLSKDSLSQDTIVILHISRYSQAANNCIMSDVNLTLSKSVARICIELRTVLTIPIARRKKKVV